MIIFPAIDVKEGQVVRLEQGDFTRQLIYSDNPLATAQDFARQGAEWLHLVDLDGAKDGISRNQEVILEIKAQTNLKIQLGGGIRSLEQMEYWLSRGIDRLVLGTLAIEKPSLVRLGVNHFGSDSLVIGIDAREGKVATHGWLKDSRSLVLDYAKEMLDLGISYLLYTDIQRDGMLAGPDLDTLEQLLDLDGAQIIASGGVSAFADLEELRRLKVYGVIIGRAIYQGVISLPQIWEKLGDIRC